MTYSSFQAGDIWVPVDFEPADAERVELHALRKLGTITEVIVDDVSGTSTKASSPMTALEDIQEANEVADETFVFNFRKCSYPLLCCKIDADMGAPFFYLVHICAAVALFASAVYFAEVVPWYEWAGVPYWNYAVFFGVLLATPIVADLLVDPAEFSSGDYA